MMFKFLCNKWYLLMWLSAWGLVARGEGVLNIYNWSDYIADNTVSNFEKEFAVKVRYDTFDTNETLHAKLVAKNSGYDIVVPGANWAYLQNQAGLLQAWDKTKISNYGNLHPKIMAQLSKIDPENKFMIPWFWGYVTVGINVDKVQRALGGQALPENPWELIFSPVYADKLKKCGISFLDSGNDIMEAMMVHTGEINAMIDQEFIQSIWKKLAGVRKNIKVFSSSGYINDLASGSLCVSMGFSSDILIASERAKLAKNGVKIQALIPKETGAVLFFDVMVLPKDAKNPLQAHQFINYRLRPEVSANDTNKVFYPSPVAGSDKWIKPEILNNKAVFLSNEVLDKMVPPRIYNNEQRRMITRAFTSFKTLKDQ
ncbi:MAG: extracellular solute-binding protein [Gammaproteobacteria bacterium]|nr:extracellular solute-binding protein [Gammaproteobacteria bacterium]